jgi:hypothetical protein
MKLGNRETFTLRISDLKEEEKRSEIPNLKWEIGINDESGRDEAKDKAVCTSCYSIS